jgi:hypothetical protein
MKMIAGRSRLPLLPMTLLLAVASATASKAQNADLTWGYTAFGTPGMIEMPTAHSAEDAEFTSFLSYFGQQGRVGITFQFSDRLSASFRYSRQGLGELDPSQSTNYDRSFSVHYRFMDEGDIRPAMAIGLNDFVGTGFYSGEYVVATKTFNPRLRGTLGLGWGRLGTVGGFTNPLGIFDERFETRPSRDSGTGGDVESAEWFRGDAAFFGGIEWMVNERLRLTAEYSSDDYSREDGAAFDYRNPFNFGLDWRYSDRGTVSARYLYGSEIGVQLTYALNPKQSIHGSGREAAPPPILPQSAAAAKSWGDLDPNRFTQALERELAHEGLVLLGTQHVGDTLRIEVRNTRYGTAAQAVGRAARILTRTAPAEVNRFDILLSENGMPVTSVVVNRGDLERLEFDPVAPDLLRARTTVEDAPFGLDPLQASYPLLSYGIEPYLITGLFDPDDPLRADLGLAAFGTYEPLPGLIFTGRIHQKIIGNLDESDRPSDSVLPRVRSDAYLYYEGDDPTIQELTAARYFRPGADLYGRITAGYLETMFGGVSGEVLWKPQNSALALGIELNYARQRDFDQLFGFQEYSVMTGHASAYYEMGGGYMGQVDVGRYLAGDFGATFTVSREFANGWKIGAFATLTDVSSEDFGEGSFDKGILLTIPLDWVTGQSSRTRLTQVLRPILRDGGARLYVSDRLYETVRGLHASELDASWGRFWR